jgi:hypothetical protein
MLCSSDCSKKKVRIKQRCVVVSSYSNGVNMNEFAGQKTVLKVQQNRVREMYQKERLENEDLFELLEGVV